MIKQNYDLKISALSIIVMLCPSLVSASEIWGGTGAANTNIPAYLPVVDTELDRSDNLPTYKPSKVFASGWAGDVDVNVDNNRPVFIGDVTAFSDGFVDNNRDKKMQGFYTMRYHFDTKLPFRPYAGAGLGVVATETGMESAGVVAGRATAGFDLAVNDQSALYAEYAYVKNGDVTLGSVQSDSNQDFGIPKSEHTLKIGFRRIF